MKRLTHANGAPVVDNVNKQTVGPRGPALLQDAWLLEKMSHFNREVIPERRMHAKGAGAYGQFTVTHDITRFTKAGVFAMIGKGTPVFVRFSTVAGERGAADAERVFSPDKMLQGRLFAYGDAARHRLGVNHHQVPVNAARGPVHSYHQDGALRMDGNSGGAVAYSPNSQRDWEGSPDLAEPHLPVQGGVGHWDHATDADDYSQPGALFRLMDEEERERLFANTARALGDADCDVRQRHVANCSRAHPAYGAGVARALGLPEVA